MRDEPVDEPGALLHQRKHAWVERGGVWCSVGRASLVQRGPCFQEPIMHQHQTGRLAINTNRAGTKHKPGRP